MNRNHEFVNRSFGEHRPHQSVEHVTQCLLPKGDRGFNMRPERNDGTMWEVADITPKRFQDEFVHKPLPCSCGGTHPGNVAQRPISKRALQRRQDLVTPNCSFFIRQVVVLQMRYSVALRETAYLSLADVRHGSPDRNTLYQSFRFAHWDVEQTAPHDQVVKNVLRDVVSVMPHEHRWRLAPVKQLPIGIVPGVPSEVFDVGSFERRSEVGTP
mmetsp:Transcript_70554/g.189972  ORF Transcript_70554/g.189972 Transcript_70554/m.189972 type:complete len:213 (-) Transcript_70554:80-718(-)